MVLIPASCTMSWTKMGTIKDRNSMNLTEAEILRRGGRNTQKNYTKKIFMTQIIMMVWSLARSQTSWNAKCALGSITTNKASGGDGIPVELFQIQKDLKCFEMLWKCCFQYTSKFGKELWPQDWKSQFSFQSQRKAMPKNVQITAQLHSSHMLAK